MKHKEYLIALIFLIASIPLVYRLIDHEDVVEPTTAEVSENRPRHYDEPIGLEAPLQRWYMATTTVSSGRYMYVIEE